MYKCKFDLREFFTASVFNTENVLQFNHGRIKELVAPSINVLKQDGSKRTSFP